MRVQRRGFLGQVAAFIGLGATASVVAGDVSKASNKFQVIEQFIERVNRTALVFGEVDQQTGAYVGWRHLADQHNMVAVSFENMPQPVLFDSAAETSLTIAEIWDRLRDAKSAVFPIVWRNYTTTYVNVEKAEIIAKIQKAEQAGQFSNAGIVLP